MGEIEGGGLEVRVVEEAGEYCGEVLVGSDTRLSSLLAGDGIVGRWVEG